MDNEVLQFIHNEPQLTSRIISLWINDEDIVSKLEGSIKFYSNLQKAALFLIAVGKDSASSIIKFLDSNEIDNVSFEICRLESVFTKETSDILFKEFLELKNLVTFKGGVDYSREMLEKAFGPEYTIEVINRLTSTLQVRPFDFIRRCDPVHVLNLIQGEHPQVIALVLSLLEPNKSSIILQNLPADLRGDVAIRIAKIDRVSPYTIRDIERSMEKRLSTLSSEDYTTMGGVECVVEMLNLVDRDCEKQVLEEIEDNDPELSEEIKKRMFVFEDIVLLDDRSIQKVMREVDSQELAKALKSVDTEVQDKIFRNMSKRASGMLREDMEYMGPIRLRDVEEAQLKIVAIIRHLEECGEIVVYRYGEDELVDSSLVGIDYDEKYYNGFLSLVMDTDKEILKSFFEETNKDELIDILEYALRGTSNEIVKRMTPNMGILERFLFKKKLKDRFVELKAVVDARKNMIDRIKNYIEENNG